MTLRLSRQDLVELIESMEAGGQETSHLRAVLAAMPQPQQQQSPHLRDERDLTTAEYLEIHVGDLFPDGITDEVLTQLIEIDRAYSLKELQVMCRSAGLASRGGKKTLAAKLLASRLIEKERPMEEEYVNLAKQREWSGKPGELTIPEAYIRDLHYEIVVFARKERGGSDFTFRCKEYRQVKQGHWRFDGVIIDTSIKNPRGDVATARLTYHPEISLVDIGFMVIPAAEDAET